VIYRAVKSIEEDDVRSVGLYAVAVVALLAIAFGAYLLAPPVAQKPQLDTSRERTTANGLFVAAIAPETPETKQGELQSWTITVKTAGGQPVSDAVIKVDGGMPEHNHGLPTAPEVTDNLGEGRYRIEGIKFSMGGWWELRFDIASPAGSDTVTFNLVL
jgi:hypothetical protein